MAKRLLFTALAAFALSVVMFLFLNITQSLAFSVVGALFTFVVGCSSILGGWFAFEQLQIARRDEIRRLAEAGQEASLHLQFWLKEPGPRPLAIGMPVKIGPTSADFQITLYVRNSGTAENQNNFHIELLMPIRVNTHNLI